MSETDTAHERAREAVRVDPDLTAGERETYFRTAQDRDHVDVFTAERGLMRRVLAHPESEVEFVNVKSGDVGGAKVPLSEYDGGAVVGVKATLPVGCLGVSRDPRKSESHADIITGRVLKQVRADGGVEVADKAPDTAELARLLDVDPGHLQRFADHHPAPEPSHLIEWADADDGYAPQVAAWLRDRKGRRARRRERLAGGGS